MVKKLSDIHRFFPFFFTFLFVGILNQYDFNSIEAIFYDAFIGLGATEDKELPIVLISQDEESEQFLGERYPYSFVSHVRLLKRILPQRPAVVGFLSAFPAPRGKEEVKAAKEFYQLMVDYQSKYGTRFRIGTDFDDDGEIFPPELLRPLGLSLALTPVDQKEFAQDSVVRRTLLSFSGEASFASWVSNEYRKFIGLSSKEPLEQFGAYYNEKVDAFYSYFQYPRSPEAKGLHLPFHKVLTGTFIPAGFFSDKIVLIGPEYYDLPRNFVKIPFNDEQLVSSLWVKGQQIAALASEQTIKKLPNWVSMVLSFALTVLLSVVISMLRPSSGLLLTVFCIIVTFSSSLVLFVFFQTWLKLTIILISIFVVYYIWVPFRAIREYQTRYAIQEETKILKRVENLKQNFISLMSHDLKTPVAKIAGSAEVLKLQAKAHPEFQRATENIVQATRELNSFINSILDLTKIESQRLQIKKTSKDINSLVEAVVEKRRYEAEVRNIEVLMELAPLYPIKVDPDLLSRVFSNLVENAIKYTEPGGKVWIRTFDDQHWITVEIADSGVGMSAQELDHIFEKFYRIKNDKTHQVKGSGLGLYLVKYFVELHQGTISVESRLGEGTTFVVKLKNE